MKPCPQCGAIQSQEQTCQQRFDISQALEFNNLVRFGGVHHLNVPCYWLQHNRYSARGWLAARDLLAKFVYENWTPAMARRAIKNQTRNGGVIGGEKLAEVEFIKWQFTIADVRLEDPEEYCADVRRWAEYILQDSAGLGGKR